MECNKEEALRAKDLAEKKFLERDFAGAKRFVKTAIRLNPSLEGISQMLPVIDVHIVSQQTLGDGEPDWYGILQVEPVASEATIKSQYKKLALLFHPDKNKAVGAESAFKLISDAWNVLSDKPKKLLHDSKRRSYQASNVKASSHADQSRGDRQNDEGASSRWEVAARVKAEEERRKEAEKELEIQKEKVRKENELRRKNEEKDKKKAEREQKKGKEKERRRKSEELKALRDRNKKPSSFKILDEIPSVASLDDQLKLDSPQIFRANELSQLEQLKQRLCQRQSREARAQRRDAAVRVVEGDLRYEQGHEQPQEMNSGCQHVPENTQADQVSGGPDTENQKGKRKNKGLEGDSKEEEAQGRQKRKVESPACTSLVDQQPKERDDEENQCPVMISREVIKQESIFAECLHGSPALHAAKECPVFENLGIVSKIKDEDAGVQVSTRMTRSMLREKDKQVSRIEGVERNVPLHDHVHVRSQKSSHEETELQHVDGEMIEVLPSQFHQFDDVRTRQSFRVGQIWAAYDDKDAMPRFYCRLKRVSRSSSPFKAHLSWLEPTTQTQKRHLNAWREGNTFAVACGEFEAGDHEDGVTEHINIFSHCIFEQLKEDPVKIYPLKAETWAIYVDWYPKLKDTQDTALEGQHLSQPFVLVEILEDYSEEQGIATVRLAQAPGFSTVFQRQECSGAINRFSPSELPAFSHRILSAKVLTDIGLPGEAWELDPASLPESMLLTSTCTL